MQFSNRGYCLSRPAIRFWIRRVHRIGHDKSGVDCEFDYSRPHCKRELTARGLGRTKPTSSNSLHGGRSRANGGSLDDDNNRRSREPLACSSVACSSAACSATCTRYAPEGDREIEMHGCCSPSYHGPYYLCEKYVRSYIRTIWFMFLIFMRTLRNYSPVTKPKLRGARWLDDSSMEKSVWFMLPPGLCGMDHQP